MTSAGIFFCNSSIEESSFSVRSRVLVLGCLVTVSKTAGLARTEAVPNLGALSPIFTSATSPINTGTPSTRFTTALAIASTSVVATAPRTMYSLPYSYKIPPLAFRFISRAALRTSSNVTPYCFIRGKSKRIWYSFISPPITVT